MTIFYISSLVIDMKLKLSMKIIWCLRSDFPSYEHNIIFINVLFWWWKILWFFSIEKMVIFIDKILIIFICIIHRSTNLSQIILIHFIYSYYMQIVNTIIIKMMIIPYKYLKKCTKMINTFLYKCINSIYFLNTDHKYYVSIFIG